MPKEPKKVTPYNAVLWKAPDFVAMSIPRRTWLVEPVMPHPGLGLLYSWRGSGKTFTALSLAISIAQGVPWMTYNVPTARGVLYIDGEMPLGDLQERVDGMTRDGIPSNLYLLASEALAEEHRNINLTVSGNRTELSSLFAAHEDIELIILDNWTSMVRGIDENDNSLMDPIKEWLILLRHGNKSVLIVHHAGKEGGQRGGSAREDVIDWSAKLERRDTRTVDSYFNFTWDKMRTGMPADPQFVMRLNQDADGRYHLTRTEGPPKPERRKWDDEIIALLKGNGPMSFKAIVVALGADGKDVSHSLDRMKTQTRVTQYPTGDFGAVE